MVSVKDIKIWSVWILATVLLIISFYKNPYDFFVNGTIIVGWLLFAIQYTMNHSELFYLFIKRIWFNIKNPSCIWNMQVELQGDLDRAVIIKIDDALNEICKEKQSFKIIKLSNTRRIYRIYTLNLEAVLEEDEGKLRFYVHDLKISFRDSKKIIDQQLSKIFEKIQYVIKADSGNFGIQVDFQEFNPYFGFFVRRLNDKDITRFNVKLRINNDQISVSKNCIEINSDSLQGLNNLSKDYLALSPPR